MYKKGVRSMPRSIKKELIKQFPEAFKSVDYIQPLVCASSKFTIQDENKLIKLLAQIPGLPSFWLVTSPDADCNGSLWLVFESKLNKCTEKEFRDMVNNHYELFVFLGYSASQYYGIY